MVGRGSLDRTTISIILFLFLFLKVVNNSAMVVCADLRDQLQIVFHKLILSKDCVE